MGTPMDVMDGLSIIYRYVENREFHEHNFQAEHDQIWCCEYNADEMEDYERKIMEKAGWFESEGAWSKFV